MKRTFYLRIILITLLSNGVNLCYAQDIHFSQFWMTPLLLNPANTGSFNANIRVIGNYKDQWRSITKNPYQTYALSLDMKLFQEKWKKSHLGVGLVFFSDRAGVTSFGTTQINIAVAYQATLNENNAVSAGIQGGYAGRGFNNNTKELRWGSQISNVNVGSPGVIIPNNNIAYGDFSGGLLWRYVSEAATMTSNDGITINAGIAVHHINQPDLSFYEVANGELFTKLVVHGNSSIGFTNTHMGLEPGVLFVKQGGSKEIVIGTMIKYWLQERSRYTGLKQEITVAVGGYYRIGDALIIASSLDLGNYKIGLSYDINLSGLTIASSGRGGVELSLKFITPIDSGPKHRSRL